MFVNIHFYTECKKWNDETQRSMMFELKIATSKNNNLSVPIIIWHIFKLSCNVRRHKWFIFRAVNCCLHIQFINKFVKVNEKWLVIWLCASLKTSFVFDSLVRVPCVAICYPETILTFELHIWTGFLKLR